MRDVVRGSASTDAATMETIREVYDSFGYVLDPHSAVAYRAWREYRSGNPGAHPGIVLATAHPAKFLDAYDGSVRAAITMPERLAGRLGKRKLAIPMAARYDAFKEFLSTTG